MPHNDKAKTVLFFIQYFVEAPSAAITALSLLRYDAAPVFGEFLPFISADPVKLCQVGWGALLHSYFQVSPEMFDWVQVQALAGPLKALHYLGCVLKVVVLLEGVPSPQSEVLSTPGVTGFHQGSLCTLLLTSLPVPAT